MVRLKSTDEGYAIARLSLQRPVSHEPQEKSLFLGYPHLGGDGLQPAWK